MATTYTVTDGAILEMAMQGVQFEQSMMVLRHYRLALTGGGTETDGPTALTEFFAEQINGVPGDIAQNFLICCSESLVNVKWRLQWIKPTRYAPKLFEGDLTSGQELTASAPPATSAAITLRAVTTGRHSRGTVHMPAVPAGWITTGRINGSGYANYEPLGNTLRQTLTSVDTIKVFTPIIYYRELFALSQDVTDYTVQSSARTMRRRVVGHGS